MIGSLLVPLVAQCIDAGPCELPTGLPWYFGLPIAGAWLAAVIGVVVLGRRFLLRRMERRRPRGAERRGIEQTAGSTDIERW